ncbi:MAG TPA: hypothetical protein VE644_12820, partial [Gaiellaceae bacterium]|nr:hypothetical protein [Gaiellaceae bacterium]
MPGRKRKRIVAGAPRIPAPSRVASGPIASAIGPVRAKETGMRETETSQSRLETLPRQRRRHEPMHERRPDDQPGREAR